MAITIIIIIIIIPAGIYLLNVDSKNTERSCKFAQSQQ